MRRALREYPLDAGLRGWIINFAKKNYWRVAGWHELDDLIQDGYICYCICHQRYVVLPYQQRKPAVVKNRRHFMALVQRTFYNHICDLSNEHTRLGEVAVPPDSPTLDRVEPSAALYAVLLRQLPVELQQLLRVLLHEAKNIPMLIHTDGTRETTNEYLCRLLNIDPELVDVQQIFRDHFAW